MPESRLDSRLLSGLEEGVRAARIDEVKAFLEDLERKTVPRADRPRVANLAWRTGLPWLALDLLNPLVRPRQERTAGLPAERAEYAAALTSIGAIFEARAILDTVDETQYGESLIYKVLALAPTWDYDVAVPLLKRYCSRTGKDRYRLLVGRVNLLAALVFLERFEEAESLLPSVLDSAKTLGANRLSGNALGLAAQLALFQGEHTRCGRYLEIAAELFARVPTLDSLFINKWRAVLKMRCGALSKGRLELKQVRASAAPKRHWETLRDCDFHEALVTRNAALLTHLYFGTPHAAYRAMILRDAKDWYSPPPEYTWSATGTRAKRAFDIQAGCERDGPSLKPGQLQHRLVQTLSSDFYSEHRPVALFAELFRGEHFNPQSSVDRVHHAIMRVRQWLATHDVPLRIHEREGHYVLRALGSYGLRQALPGTAAAGSVEALLRRLELPREIEFDRALVCSKLNVSKSNAIRFLNDAIAAGHIKSVNTGRACRYRLL